MNKISIADDKNTDLKKLIGCFLEKSSFSTEKTLLLVTEGAEKTEETFDVCVVPYGQKYAGMKNTVTYSLSNNNADVVLINIQNHPDSKSFEIMTDQSMGRVFINHKNKISVETVLQCASVFYALDMELTDVLSVLNSILK